MIGAVASLTAAYTGIKHRSLANLNAANPILSRGLTVESGPGAFWIVERAEYIANHLQAFETLAGADGILNAADFVAEKAYLEEQNIEQNYRRAIQYDRDGDGSLTDAELAAGTVQIRSICLVLGGKNECPDGDAEKIVPLKETSVYAGLLEQDLNGDQVLTTRELRVPDINFVKHGASSPTLQLILAYLALDPDAENELTKSELTSLLKRTYPFFRSDKDSIVRKHVNGFPYGPTGRLVCGKNGVDRKKPYCR